MSRSIERERNRGLGLERIAEELCRRVAGGWKGFDDAHFRASFGHTCHEVEFVWRVAQVNEESWVDRTDSATEIPGLIFDQALESGYFVY